MTDNEHPAQCTLEGADAPGADALVRRLADEDLLGQLLGRGGRMRALADEGGDVKLDWVDGVEQAIGRPEWIAGLVDEAVAILDAGMRRVIWSGMGGSVQTVYCLKRFGYLDLPELSIHPLDSTDPASLNRVLLEMAAKERIDVRTALGDSAGLRQAICRLLDTTMITGVSMGMTSEEPITHLTWFDGLLREFQISKPEQHVQVMTLPGSYLDRFAKERGARMTPIQLDGQSHTPGRMSAPATRVFLRPIALALAARQRSGGAAAKEALGRLLQRCQERYGVSHQEDAEARRARTLTDPFIRLGAYMASEAMERRRNKLVLILPSAWRGLGPWVEQLVEESLGKGGKGWLIFYDQDLDPLRRGDDCVFLAVQPRFEGEVAPAQAAALRSAGQPVLTLTVPVDGDDDLPRGLSALAGLFASWKLAVAAFGYLHDIVVAGQPGVEGYKAYARELRDGPGEINFGGDITSRSGAVTLDASAVTAEHAHAAPGLAQVMAGFNGDSSSAVDLLAAILLLARKQGWLRYLDFTFNGELDAAVLASLEEARIWIGGRALGMPVKLRTGPSDYHSTEQSETDGPPELVSIRIVALRHDEPIVGEYTDRFLLAQARGTWQAMRDAGRWVVMVTVPDSRDAEAELRRFFAAVGSRVRAAGRD